jgi:hypothetical protein
LFLAIHYSRLHDHEVIWAYGKLVATQLLKDDSIKANHSKLVSTFEPHEPYDIFAEFDMDSLLLFPHLLLVSRVFRLVINQSVCSWSEVYTRCLELSCCCVALEGYILYYCIMFIKHLSLDITLICDYM